MATHGCAHAEIISASDRSARSVRMPWAWMVVGLSQSAPDCDKASRQQFPVWVAGGDPGKLRRNCRGILIRRIGRESFHSGEDSVKGKHSLRPFQRRLRVRPSFDVDASAGAAKCLQILSFCRHMRHSPGFRVRQGKKNASGTKSSGMVNRARGHFLSLDKEKPRRSGA